MALCLEVLPAILQVFGEIAPAGLTADLWCHAALLNAYATGGQWKKAVIGFDGMVRGGIQPDAITYTIVIKALVDGEQYYEALDVYEEMREQHLKETIVTYAAVVKACMKGRLQARAKGYYDEMVSKGIEPDERFDILFAKPEAVGS